MYSAEQLRSNQFGIREEYDNIIKDTRIMIKPMSIDERFEKAKSHILDALKNKQPRPASYSPQLTPLYHVCYFLQSSTLWEWMTFILSYVYMYLVILDNQSYVQKVTVEGSILLIFLLDTFIDFYCKSFDKFKRKNKYPNFYFWKVFLMILMLIDLILFVTMPCYNSRPIRPFRILRAFIPVCFDPQIKKSLIALASAYKDLLVFLIYYTVIIIGFAFVGSRSMTFDQNFVDPNFPQKMDPFINNYSNLGTMIYATYTLATYDNYFDNEILAVQNYQPNQIFFIVFIFFNMFLFASIPGSLIYNKFRQTRSKYILVDQIKQQHSLILAFVTLAQEENNLSIDILINFLFFFYKKKIRYVEYITDICLRLDDNNNQTIQVNQFMQLSKIILYNSIMFPPAFQDFQIWLDFRHFINDYFKLKEIVTHWIFELIISLLILLCFINVIILIYGSSSQAQVFDSIFIWLFLAQLLLKIIGIGPQKFFADRWNCIDALLIILNIIFFFVNGNPKVNSIIRLNRMIRIAGLIKNVAYCHFISSKKIAIIQKLKRLFSTFLEIMPIIVKFFHLFVFFFFIFGVLGIQIFYTSQEMNDDSNYNQFIQFANFKSFINSQYIMIQILTEGNWSTIAYDYSWRNPDLFGLITILFTLMHFFIVTVVGTLLKGIFWEIYFTVSEMMDQIEDNISNQILRDQENHIKTQQMNEINSKIYHNQTFEPNTMIKRQIIEKKLDVQILKRIKDNQLQGIDECSGQKSFRSINRSKIVQKIMQNWNITPKELVEHHIKKKVSLGGPPNKNKKKRGIQFNQIEDKQQQDYQQQMEELLNKLIISPKIGYSEIIAYPKVFVNYLNSKFKHPQELINGDKFDLSLNPLFNEQSMSFHIYEMNAVLGIEPSKRQKKSMIVECLTKNKLIDQNLAEKIIKTNMMIKRFHIDTNGALRKMYLSQTNEDLIKKFQIQYFSDVYGNSFKQINKITLEPLLKFQASLTYTLWNILRYPQIDNYDFFHLITHIEDQMSNKLLKKGSLVKFIYKMNDQSDIWFLIELKGNQQMQVRFIKTGLWVCTPQMEQNKIYYGKDIFNMSLEDSRDVKVCQQYMKLFYQSFQTLAFSLIDKKHFFQSNPSQYMYDLYLQNFGVFNKTNRRSSFGQLQISNIMMVVLAKQEERIDIGQKVLPYQISDIRSQPKKIKKQDFILDDEDRQTFQKLKNLSARDHQKIIDSEGLPFSYIVNLMKHVSDIMKLYSQNFVTQVQKALNERYNLVNQTESTNEDLISVPQVKVFLNEDTD